MNEELINNVIPLFSIIEGKIHALKWIQNDEELL